MAIDQLSIEQMKGRHIRAQKKNTKEAAAQRSRRERGRATVVSRSNRKRERTIDTETTPLHARHACG